MKNTLMIVKGKITLLTKSDVRDLFRFLKLTAGNYRNAVFTECRCGDKYMLVADEDMQPVLFPMRKYYELTGELPQADEMCGTLGRQAFCNLYRNWILWNTDGSECPICALYKKRKTEVL